MTGVNDAPVTLTCGDCGYEFSKTIGWLKRQKSMTCPGCGENIDLAEKHVRDAITTVERALKKFAKDIKNI